MFVLFSFFFFKQKTAYEMRISDWSSDVCSSDLRISVALGGSPFDLGHQLVARASRRHGVHFPHRGRREHLRSPPADLRPAAGRHGIPLSLLYHAEKGSVRHRRRRIFGYAALRRASLVLSARSDEHTSELQSLKRNS